MENVITKEIQNHPWNVVTEDDFKTRMSEIFDMVAESLSQTVGPYGSSTLIESLGTYHLTKDGFTVLKNIHFNNRTDNTILNLILTISHQMVMKVGDGSTTSILAAHEFLEVLKDNKVLSLVRPKDISAIVQNYIEKLIKIIQTNATQVTDADYVAVCENTARIATNDNEEYTKYIKEIYEKCGQNVTISKKLSPTNESSYEIKNDMFFINAQYIDKIYCNSDNGARCDIENPAIVQFNFTLEDKHWKFVTAIMQYLNNLKNPRRLVVIAPHYDQYFIDHVKSDVLKFRNWYQQQQHQAGAIPFPMVVVKSPFFKSNDKTIFDDLTGYLGSALISPLDADEVIEKIDSYMQVAGEYNRLSREAVDNPEVEMPSDDGKHYLDEAEEIYKARIGYCDKISIGNTVTEFSGFSNKDNDIILVRQRDAESQLADELKDLENLRYVSKDYLDAKERIARLSCKSAVINIGGNTDLEKSLNEDALDDAIKACESVVRYGYNLGCNMAIFKAITEDAKTLDSNSLEYEVNKLLYTAFAKVIETIFKNKDSEWKLSTIKESIIPTGLSENKCYNLNTDNFDSDVINSCRTDIEILRGAISIVGTILSANQYLSVEIKK